MKRSDLLIVMMASLALSANAVAEPIPVRHIQKPMHRFMVARTEDGKTIASGEFTQVVTGSEVMMRLTYRLAMARLMTRRRSIPKAERFG